jgi:hypothetical protein
MATVITCKTLPKIDPQEPIFVLRGQDVLAAKAVRDWASRALMAGCPPEKVREALKCAEEMEAWPNRKVPD